MSEVAERPLTLGEYRVGITFNPGNHLGVKDIKIAAAAFIDLCAMIPKPEDPETRNEVSRLIALAMTNMEDAAMWAVKAATKPTR